MNTLKTVFLMTAMMMLFLLVGAAIGGQQGMVIAFVLSLVMNFGSYWFSDRIVLKMYKAQEVSRNEAPELYDIVEDLSAKANLPMPKVYIMNNPTPNAFATSFAPMFQAMCETAQAQHALKSACRSTEEAPLTCGGAPSS